jgi:hypothetical protein
MTPEFKRRMGSYLLLGVLLGLAAVAILSGPLAKDKPKTPDTRAPNVTVVVPQPMRPDPLAPPPAIPDAKRYPL